MTTPTLGSQTRAFLDYMEEWRRSLLPFSLMDELPSPEQTVVFAADLVVGFCSEGALASPRIEGIVPAAVRVFARAFEAGVPHFVLTQDTHSHDAEEFRAFPPHCQRGSKESETIADLKALPFSHQFTVVEKNSLHPALGTGLDLWLEQHRGLRDFIVVGDCTDLCLYSVAMHLRLRANALDLKQRVIVPANAVQTYDLPIGTANELGALAHPGDFFHLTFLYHLALNGVQVVKEVV